MDEIFEKWTTLPIEQKQIYADLQGKDIAWMENVFMQWFAYKMIALEQGHPVSFQIIDYPCKKVIMTINVYLREFSGVMPTYSSHDINVEFYEDTYDTKYAKELFACFSANYYAFGQQTNKSHYDAIKEFFEDKQD